MPLEITNGEVTRWEVRKIAVVGPGIVGMPMAALLAHARITEGRSEPATVTVIQRDSPTSGWKVEAINRGRSPIGGVEPGLDAIVADAVKAGLLQASHDFEDLHDADVVLISVQTDKKGLAPDYGPLDAALDRVTAALARRPAGNVPLVIFESTLAPSSMSTVIRERFERAGLIEGRDVLLGNSPNRVMPGRLVDRVAAADKIAGGLSPATPQLIRRLYRRIVTDGTIHVTNSLTAEVVKTLENAYRDVRIAFSAEVVRWCDARGIDFYRLRHDVNQRLDQTDLAGADPNAVPSGGLLVPTVGVGGHCLPKDGILLYWRWIESGRPTEASLILEARVVNDESPAETITMAERAFGSLAGQRVALLGAAYRFNSEDTRNSPTLVLARQLVEAGVSVRIHDPYVKGDDQNLLRFGMADRFTTDLAEALEGADLAILCAAHAVYADLAVPMKRAGVGRLVDGCHLVGHHDRARWPGRVIGIGHGATPPTPELVDQVYKGFRAMERGVANEVAALVDFLNEAYADTEFERVAMDTVQRLARTCVTGCVIVDPGPVEWCPVAGGVPSRLVQRAMWGSPALTAARPGSGRGPA